MKVGPEVYFGGRVDTELSSTTKTFSGSASLKVGF